jgi:hypothetical protein
MSAMTDRQDQQALEDAEEIIRRFGGIRPMSHKIGIPVTTIQGWKKRNVIPGNRRNAVLAAAQNNNIDLSDILEHGIANENSSEDPPQTVHEYRQKQPLPQTPHRMHITEPQQEENESFLSELRDSHGAINQKGVWVWGPMLLFLLAVGVGIAGIYTILPTKQEVIDNSRKILSLREKNKVIEGDINELQDSQFHLMGLLPDDLEAKVEALQKKADKIKTTVNELSSQAENLSGIAGNVFAEDAGPLSVRIARIEQELETLTGSSYGLDTLLDRINAMQQTVEGQTQLSRAFEELYGLIAKSSTDAEDNRDMETVLQEEISSNETLSMTLEGVPQDDLKAAATLLALTKFRSSLNRNAPFEEDLMLMQKMLGDKDPELNAAIERLAPRAQEGVLTTEGLSSEFKALAGDIVVSSLKGEDVSVKEKAKARFHEILQVEKNGEPVTGTDTQATVLRAQRLLDEGKIEEAIAELQSLEGDAAQTAQPWLKEAELTLDAERLQDLLAGNVLSGFGGADFGNASSSASSALYTTKSLGLKSVRDIKRRLSGGKELVIDKKSGFAILPQQKHPDTQDMPDMNDTLAP